MDLRHVRDLARELRVVELCVRATPREELDVVPLLNDPAAVHHENRICVADRGQAVSDDEARAL